MPRYSGAWLILLKEEIMKYGARLCAGCGMLSEAGDNEPYPCRESFRTDREYRMAVEEWKINHRHNN